MRVAIAVEARFSRTPDGRVWTQHGPANRFFSRYRSAFDTVRVVARVLDVATAPDGARQVNGDRIEVWPVPHYIGPWQYLTCRSAVIRTVQAAAHDDDAVIIRGPSLIGTLLAAARERRRRPFALEVMADPYDVYAPGVVRHPLRPLLRRRQTGALRYQCQAAIAVAYVTDAYLQARYPAAAGAVTASYSSVDLPADAYLAEPRPERPLVPGAVATLVSVGTLEQMYKGVDVLLQALALLRVEGPPIRLVHVGEGRCRPRIEKLAARLGVADRVHLTGALTAGDEVRRHLDAADLFVMPSRTEGLPKALVEAMARGLPAIGSAVGGIPELLHPDDLVPPGDPTRLAGSIRRFLADPARMATASARNLARAGGFRDEVLGRRRDDFYQAIRDFTHGAVEPTGIDRRPLAGIHPTRTSALEQNRTPTC